MPVIPLAFIISLCLVFTVVIFILREHLQRATNTTRVLVRQPTGEAPLPAGAHHHDHDDDPDGCGCRSGRHAPCVGCLKRPPVTSAR